jgi:hypothetical protein
MAFNLTSWSRTGRDFGRGSPPPRGSIEWVGVTDMFYPELQRPASSSGFQVYEVSYTELDAAKRWVEGVDRSVLAARRVHGGEILSAADQLAWEDFMARWRPFYFDMTFPGHFSAMLSANKKIFDDLLRESRQLYEKFTEKGMSPVPVPYAGELLEVLRGTPKRLTAAEMSSRLRAGARCGEKMLDANMTWSDWLVSRDHRGLVSAISDARGAADIYSRSRSSGRTYSPGEPAYDEFLRRLSKIWIEAAGLAGVREASATARAELKDDARQLPERAAHLSLWLLALAGASYLGVAWLARPRAPQTIVVGVPDAVGGEP